MTISTTASAVTLAGNGATGSFAFSFIAGAASNVVVTYTDASGVQTTLAQSQYTLSINAAAAGQIWGVGGTVTYPVSGAPIATGTLLTIQRIVPITQIVSISNQGDFYAQSVEKALDALCMEIQQVSAAAGRAILFNVADTGPFGMLPPAAQRANQLLGFDSSGNPIVAQPTGALVSAAMQPVVDAATLAAAITVLTAAGFISAGTVTAPGVVVTGASGNVTSPGLIINGAPVIAQTPIGQAGETLYTPAEVTTTTAAGNAGQHVFGFSVNLTNNNGGGASVPDSFNRAGIYSAVETQPGGGNGWAFNGLLYIDSGAAVIGGQQICEWDLANNSGTHFGDAPGFAGDEQPAVFGMQITGISTNRVTAAIAILGNIGGNAPMWNRGITAGPMTISQSFLEDFSSCQQSYLIQGSHTYGIDCQGQTNTPAVFSGGAVRYGAQHKVLWRNQANTADLDMIQSSGTDQLLLGVGATSVVVSTSFAHTGPQLGFFNGAPITKPSISGSIGGNAGLSSLIGALVNLGLITSNVTA